MEAVIEGRTGRYSRDGDVEDLVNKMESMLYPVPCKQGMSEACMRIIDEFYTPEYQERVILRHSTPCCRRISIFRCRYDDHAPGRGFRNGR